MSAAGLLALLGVVAVPGGPWTGFVCHFPFLPEGTPAYRESGATMALVRCSWATVEATPDHFDFASLDQELAWADEQGVQVLVVFEAGPAHAPNWAVEQVRAAGEGTVDIDGNPGPYPSIFSPIYGRLLDRFIARSAGYLRGHPRAGRILGYNNGCEWWYPDGYAFAELDRAAFEAAMVRRYGSRQAARAVWGLTGDGPLERPRVVLEGGSGADHFAELVPLEQRFDGCWMTHDEHLQVTAGQRYTFAADVRVTRRVRGAAYVQIAWLGDWPQPLKCVNSTMSSRAEWTRVQVTDTAPAGATRAWLLVKTCAVAETSFRRPSFQPAGGAEMLGGKPLGGPAWVKQTWLSPKPEQAVYRAGRAEASVIHLRADDGQVSAAWVDDWFDFMGDAVAEFIGSVADRLRAADPGRPIVTYLTMSFAAPFCWDENYSSHVHPEKVFAARRYEGLGMQLAAADGEWHHVTAGVDLVRQWGEPWLIDLQDFTAGIHVGEKVMTRTTLAGIAAGARGVVYYGWYDRFVPDYSFRDGWPIEAVRRMVGASNELLARQVGGRVPVDVALEHPAVPPLPGRGEPDPGRLMLLYRALRRLGLGVAIVPHGGTPPDDVPLFTVADVPDSLRPEVRRSTEAGNTPPMFKLLPTEANRSKLAQLVRRLAERLGRSVPRDEREPFPWVDAAGERHQFSPPYGHAFGVPVGPATWRRGRRGHAGGV
ncbi:MAG: hypothetical protein HYU66_13115 [Armatimonadetes bacterium]|nr:hypothetical protein [Armatimonadota bacterium]